MNQQVDGTITIPAGHTVDLSVQMSANPAQMQNTRDSSVSGIQAFTASPAVGNVNRHWLTEEASYLNFSQSGTVKLRVPVYAAPRPASSISAGNTITTGGAPTGSTTIPLSGISV